MQIFPTDLRHVWRRALRQMGITLSIIALLALGMGGVTAVFNPIYTTLFTPLPFPLPEQLVRIGGNIPLFNMLTSNFEKEEILGRIFSNMAAYRPYQSRIRIPDTNKQIEVNALAVSENFFETLGVKPLIGYDCTHKEKSNGFVVSHRFWRNELNQKTDVVGSPVLLSGGRQVSIIGIMPEGFDFPFDTDVWECRNSGMHWGDTNPGGVRHFIGRLRAGMTSGQAAKELRANFEPVAMVVSILPGNGPLLQPLQTFLHGDQRPMLRMLSVAAILFLALVCAGVVNLLIAQGARRKQEIATRLILGATRRNLIFQLLREMLPLVVTGGLLGWWLSEIASAWLWTQLPALHGVAVDVPVKIAFWAILALVVMFIGGLVPSLYATSLDLNTYLKSASSGQRKFFSSREFLVGVQLSVALALLIGVGVLLRTIMFNVDVPVGWSSRDIAVVSIAHPNAGFTPLGEEGRYIGLNQDIQRKLSGMPEVVSIGYLSPIPFSAAAIRNSMTRWPVSKPSTRQGATQAIQNISPETLPVIRITANSGGFDMLGIPLVAGRHFTDIDAEDYLRKDVGRGLAGGTAIINQALAQRLWPEEKNTLGEIFYFGGIAPYEVVGVVQNYHHIPDKDFIPAIYVPYTGAGSSADFLVKLRPDASTHDFHASVRKRLSGFALDWVAVQPLSEFIKDTTANQRLMLQLLSCFAVLGVVVSGLAVYATATAAATARNRETGIRMALGAQAWDILRLAFWRGIRTILLGLPFGIFLALILSKVLSSFLVYVNIIDPLVWLISCAVLLGITAVAAFIPALRALRMNAIDAMRNE